MQGRVGKYCYVEMSHTDVFGANIHRIHKLVENLLETKYRFKGLDTYITRLLFFFYSLSCFVKIKTNKKNNKIFNISHATLM